MFSIWPGSLLGGFGGSFITIKSSMAKPTTPPEEGEGSKPKKGLLLPTESNIHDF